MIRKRTTGLTAALVSFVVLAAIPPTLGADPSAKPAAPTVQTAPATSAANTASNQSITGKIDIAYNSRVQVDDNGNPKEGVQDVYTFNVDVTPTINYSGTIKYQPTILSSVLGRETQASTLAYDLSMSLRNPQNLGQSKMIGKLVGTVPIDKKGIYHYGDGTLRAAVDATGKAAGFESKFQGLAAGKPPKDKSTLGSIKKQAVSVTKMVKGSAVKITVTDYDVMMFTDLVMAAGPVKAFPDTRVNGRVLYDYERSAWYFDGVTMTYTGADGKAITDKLSGNIKWVEDPQRLSNGLGEYQFDVRVNEPQQAAGENAAFQAVENEADFFTADATLPCLTGSMKYKDTIRANPNAPADATADEKVIVSASAVTINLTANNLGTDKTRIMNLWKLLGLVEVVPMNAE